MSQSISPKAQNYLRLISCNGWRGVWRPVSAADDISIRSKHHVRGCSTALINPVLHRLYFCTVFLNIGQNLIDNKFDWQHFLQSSSVTSNAHTLYRRHTRCTQALSQVSVLKGSDQPLSLKLHKFKFCGSDESITGAWAHERAWRAMMYMSLAKHKFMKMNRLTRKCAHI